MTMTEERYRWEIMRRTPTYRRISSSTDLEDRVSTQYISRIFNPERKDHPFIIFPRCFERLKEDADEAVYNTDFKFEHLVAFEYDGKLLSSGHFKSALNTIREIDGPFPYEVSLIKIVNPDEVEDGTGWISRNDFEMAKTETLRLQIDISELNTDIRRDILERIRELLESIELARKAPIKDDNYRIRNWGQKLKCYDMLMEKTEVMEIAREVFPDAFDENRIRNQLEQEAELLGLCSEKMEEKVGDQIITNEENRIRDVSRYAKAVEKEINKYDSLVKRLLDT